jgi:hypothetical protein
MRLIWKTAPAGAQEGQGMTIILGQDQAKGPFRGLRLLAVCVSLFVALACHARAEDDAGPIEDGATIDALIAATYDVISGPAGEERDWDRFRALFIDGALMIPRAEASSGSFRTITPEQYIERSGPYLVENGFFEMEIGRTVHRYGDVAQVMSAYAAKNALDDPAPFMRGVNAFQLVHDGSRWWIASLAWQQESEALPVPEEYLQ